MRNIFFEKVADPGFYVPSSFLVPKLKKIFFEGIASFQETRIFFPPENKGLPLNIFLFGAGLGNTLTARIFRLIKVPAEVLESGGSYMFTICRNHVSLDRP